MPTLLRPTVRRRPTGITLPEVLISIGVLAIGLLGVAAVFPVGGFYMQSGDIADRGGAIAQAALSDAITRGHLDPNNWVMHDVNDKEWDLNNSTFSDGLDPYFMEFVTGDYAVNPTTTTPLNPRMGLLRAQTVSDANVSGFSTRYPATTATAAAYRSVFFGDAYVIDPIGVASALADDSDNEYVDDGILVKSAPARHFPGFALPSSYNAIDGSASDPTRTGEWTPWNMSTTVWPVRRVTTKNIHQTALLNNPNFYDLQKPLADAFFTADDDLAQFLPNAGDEPNRQRWEVWDDTSSTANAPYASVRQSRGDYSWIITVAPSSSSDRDRMATSPDSATVEVSVTVFYKRVQARGPQAVADSERLVTARVTSVSPGGGEMLLTRIDPATSSSLAINEPTISPFQDLRTGQYVMVVGPHPQSTLIEPRLAVRWCRVLSIEEEGSPTLADGSTVTLDEDNQVIVALRGPDWPWQPATASGSLDFTDNTLPSNDLRVAILPGAVAVHTKTMRLEAGSEWSID